ncbi:MULTISPECIES: ATP-binding protein [unclassified Bradyrhizobium]|uniref:ATP-binding protein n=1 Tax=unclassified Bradyrhizobium TaxID=2631580 RepID=UPI0029160A7F|nr:MULTISPECIES: AAA family ATPase [unclassified Bradyrhizobium]
MLRQPSSDTTTSSRLLGMHRAERRQVTALICDLVGSVSLTVRLDPEDMTSVIDAFLTTCENVIGRHGGAITQYAGDGVLAYFGYPRAGEDDAATAIRAAIALRDAVGRLDAPQGQPLRLRIGIATGLVVVSDLMPRADGRPVDIVGETPNLAARLQSIAAPDSIVVARTTERIARGMFDFRDLGTFALKGFAAPVEAFEVLEEAAVASRFHARIRGESSPLVGRDQELARLFDCWAAARFGSGQVVLLHGEPGIGKSRLVEELRRRVADVSQLQMIWHCSPTRCDSVLYPISEQLALIAGFDRTDGAATRRDKLDRFMNAHGVTDTTARAVLADVLGVAPEPDNPLQTMTVEKRSEVTRETLLRLIDMMVPTGPALLVLEDAHWSDTTTLELLDRAIQRAAQRRWLIVVTARLEYEPPWAASPKVTRLPLGRLSQGDAERICTHVAASAALPAATLRQIVNRGEGIPLFLEELAKYVVEASAAPARDGHASVAIPASLQDSLVARLDRLGPARRIANLGAAIGRRFSYDLLSAIVAEPEARLGESLDQLVKSGLVESSGAPPDSLYTFKHALIRDAAYESLLRRERQTLHGRIAAVLRDRFPETRDTEPELLAYHFTESGAIAEAIPLWADAGRRAASRAAHVEAARHLQTALDLLRHQSADGERADLELELLIGLAVSLAASRGYTVPEVGKALSEARAICDALGNTAGLFAVLRGICSFLIIAGDLDGAEEMAHLCLGIGEQTGLPEHRIESGVALGYILFARGDLPAARRLLAAAVQLYQASDGARLPQLSSQDPLVAGQASLLQVLHAMGDDAGAAAVASDLIAHARRLGRPFDLAWALSWLAFYQLARGDYEDVLLATEEALRICRDHGYPLYQLVAGSLQAHARGHLGRTPDEALAAASEALPAFQTLGMMHFSCFYLGEVAGLQLIVGKTAEAMQTIDAAIDAARRYGDGYFLSPLHRRRAEILAALPDTAPGQVTAALREAVAVAEAQGASAFLRRAAARLAAIDDDAPRRQSA